MSLARTNFKNTEVLHRVLKIVYVMTKVRGYKTVGRLHFPYFASLPTERFFPHEVVDFEPTFELLKSQNQADFVTWETRYVLLLWVSVLVLIPFDISTIDSQTVFTFSLHFVYHWYLHLSQFSNYEKKSKEPLLDQIVTIGKSYLKDTGKCKDAASILLSRALTRYINECIIVKYQRPDFGLKQLPAFLFWCNEIISSSNDSFLVAHFSMNFLLTTRLLESWQFYLPYLKEEKDKNF